MSMAKRGTKTVVPRLRFPKFRNAAAWEKKPLSTLLDYERPDKYIVSDTTYQDSGTPVLTANKSFVLGYTNESNGVYSATPVVIFDDFTTDKKYVDFSFKVKSSAIKILKAKGDDSLRLIFELMRGIKFDPKEHKRYYISEYQNLEIAIPRHAEQQKIADCLMSLDEVVAAQGCKLEALKAHKRSLIQQLFPREGKTRPSLRFPEFRNAAEWKSATVDTLSSTITPPRKIPTSGYGAEGLLPIIDQSPDPICGWTNDLDAKVDARYPLIIFGDHTCVLKLVEHDFAQGADGIKIISALPHIDIRFLYFALQADPVTSASYRRHFSLLQEKHIAFPEGLKEQQHIADCFSSLDAKITAESRQLAALKTHKQGLMQQLFPTPEAAGA